jgi:DinB superfamily
VVSKEEEKSLRDYLRKLPVWHEAHADLKSAVSNIPPKCQGKRPKGAPHSPWELLEHMRLASWDILEFSRNPKHVSPPWPSGYWPESANPPNDAAWDESVESLRKALTAMGKLVADPKTDLFARLPHGSGQTILREAVLLADHNAYHVGQLVLVRRLLGCWEAD